MHSSSHSSSKSSTSGEESSNAKKPIPPFERATMAATRVGDSTQEDTIASFIARLAFYTN
ncbi:hypothetical protein M408DRAFT_332233 [Serendipita vermifera MAFF 305830]|uniref:Uncharacterized protein n=1 Tax=Serendipita vermifera MAFF 305830 TaxID=933852 RepID=A0A0C3AG62_SERVB|nr:hypothetical protein M408DRAFT_332233 [Serendipita vermifera MAFF 305830]